jgi:hypothetical protein
MTIAKTTLATMSPTGLCVGATHTSATDDARLRGLAGDGNGLPGSEPKRSPPVALAKILSHVDVHPEGPGAVLVNLTVQQGYAAGLRVETGSTGGVNDSRAIDSGKQSLKLSFLPGQTVSVVQFDPVTKAELARIDVGGPNSSYPTAAPAPRANQTTVPVHAPQASAVNARTASDVAMIMHSALVTLRDVEKNGKKGTPPPMLARAMFYVSHAVTQVYRAHDGKGADRIAKSVAQQVLAGLLGLENTADAKPGAEMVASVLARAASDGASQASAPRGYAKPAEHQWTPKDIKGNDITALLPSFGLVRPVLAKNASVRAKEPSFGDDDWRNHFKTSAKPNETEVNCAKHWADGPGTFTPPGHWNEIAADVLGLLKTNNADSAMVFGALNTALFDAGISCWDTKYTYGCERPFQAAQRLGIAFEPALGTPPFPGYTSGHATFSAAAAEVLGAYIDQVGGADKVRAMLVGVAQMPSVRAEVRCATTATEMMRALAREAADSRVMGGIHISDDGVAGVDAGARIGQNVVQATWSAEA